MSLTIRRQAATANAAPRLLLKPLEAADALGISERKLRDLTEPHGPIPVVRVGRLVRYRVSALESWARSVETGGAS